MCLALPAGACSSGGSVERTVLAPSPATVPTTSVGLTQPIAIPSDPYASEAVRRIGTIEIPKLGLVHAVFDGVTLNNIDQGPSHWPGSAMPGRPGNTVFAGHRVTHDHPFMYIDRLVAGDTVIFTVDGVRSTYRVTTTFVVGPDDTWIADQAPESTGTLYACHPPGSAEKRYVVRLSLLT
jgi:sortase A